MTVPFHHGPSKALPARTAGATHHGQHRHQGHRPGTLKSPAATVRLHRWEWSGPWPRSRFWGQTGTWNHLHGFVWVWTNGKKPKTKKQTNLVLVIFCVCFLMFFGSLPIMNQSLGLWLPNIWLDQMMVWQELNVSGVDVCWPIAIVYIYQYIMVICG